jgi:polysaccharide deacetylase family protein (PEP-CTERM system associated)
VEFATNQLLDLFAQSGLRATFFTLGWVAERHPQLVRRMSAEGHEVACHGYNHTRATTQSQAEFRADITRSKAILEDIAGVAVVGYRAASFSIDGSNLWAFPEIEAAGFSYSSSVYPVRHDLYGAPHAPRVPFRPPSTAALTEIPVSTVRVGSRNLPAGGGGFFRLLPYAVSRALIRRVNLRDLRAANMYFHPWEFDPQQPRPSGVGLKSRFRHYHNQTRSLDRMRSLIGDFSWAPFRDVYRDVLGGRCQLTVGSAAFARP